MKPEVIYSGSGVGLNKQLENLIFNFCMQAQYKRGLVRLEGNNFSFLSEMMKLGIQWCQF